MCFFIFVCVCMVLSVDVDVLDVCVIDEFVCVFGGDVVVDIVVYGEEKFACWFDFVLIKLLSVDDDDDVKKVWECVVDVMYVVL